MVKNDKIFPVFGRWIIYLLIFMVNPVVLHSQNLNKEVYVVSSYKPEIAEAEKISRLPDISDTLSLETKADFTVLPFQLESDFSLRPIKPAKLTGTALDKLYNSHLKLGFGNYATPLAEYSIHNLRSKEHAIGAYFFHKSSHTKLKLENGANVPAGYGKNDLALYGKKFQKNFNLHAVAGAKTRKIRYYGYNTDNFTDSVPVPEAKDIKQFYTNLYGEIGVYSTNPDTNSLNYSISLKGQYFFDDYSNKEPRFQAKAAIAYPVKSFRIGMEADYDYYGLENETDAYRESVFGLRPYFTKRRDEWEVKLAGRIYLESEENQTKIYPEASIRFQVIENSLISYFGIFGYLENNSYQSIVSSNPYTYPGLHPKNTYHQFVAFAGLEGHLSSKAAYRLNVTFDAMENSLFFINDTTDIMANRFLLVYDDVDLVTYYGEIRWKPLINLEFFLKSKVYSYKMAAEEKPWHKPGFDFTFTTRYNFKEKIYSEMDIIAYGERYAKDLSEADGMIKLEPVFDLNLKLEYKYSDILSGYIHFHNLLAQQNYLWNQYPTQRFNFLLGISYKF